MRDRFAIVVVSVACVFVLRVVDAVVNVFGYQGM